MTDSHNVMKAPSGNRPAAAGAVSKLLLAAIAGLLIYAGWDAYPGARCRHSRWAGGQGDGRSLVRGLLVETPRGFFPVLGAAAFDGEPIWCWRCGATGIGMCAMCRVRGAWRISAVCVGACG